MKAQVLTCTRDRYGGVKVTVDGSKFSGVREFGAALDTSLAHWRANKRRGVWCVACGAHARAQHELEQD